jgi:hypothetical protein
VRSLVLIGLCAVGLAGRAAAAQPRSGRTHPRAAIQAYLWQVEPIRLAVNRLLGRADPILEAYHDHHASPAQAGRRMGLLERRFADYTVKVAAIEPPPRSCARCRLGMPYACARGRVFERARKLLG